MMCYTRKAFDVAARVIPAEVLARREEVWPATIRALAVHESEPQGLIHSDVHIGNWYRTGAGQMGLCDWQYLSRGHWSRDFAYAVTASLTPDDRRNWERDLLARYIERFAEKTGIKPDFDLSFMHYGSRSCMRLRCGRSRAATRGYCPRCSLRTRRSP